jgi:hypothetical protein
MGFLQRFFRNVLRDEPAPVSISSFRGLTKRELEEHLEVRCYGDFVLTDAVRPSFDLQVIPRQGYRHDFYHDDDSGTKVPVLMAACSRDNLFELFLDLLDPLGDRVDVVLETSHNRECPGHEDLYREQIDMPVLKSVLYDFEDLLLDDGCTGIAVLNPDIPQEVQFDEHKLLIVYGEDLEPFEQRLREVGLPCDDHMKFLTEAEHVHSSSDVFAEHFEQLRLRLGLDN